MPREYRLVPAPDRPARKAPGSDEAARYLATLEGEINAMAAEGWQFIRTEDLTFQRRKGLFSRTEDSLTALVFVRGGESPMALTERVAEDAEPPADAPRRPHVRGPALRAERAAARRRESPAPGGEREDSP